MGANDAAEMLEVAKEECARLERELAAALAVIEGVKAARSDHPKCDVHTDDDPISCGWKHAVIDIDRALAPESPAKPLSDDPAPLTRTGATNAQRDE